MAILVARESRHGCRWAGENDAGEEFPGLNSKPHQTGGFERLELIDSGS